MGYRPPRVFPPPQLEGKRTGRPKGSRNLVGAWRDVVWGYENRFQHSVNPPTAGAAIWWKFAQEHGEEVEAFLDCHGLL